MEDVLDKNSSTRMMKMREALSWFKMKKIKLLRWPGPLPDLNPTGNLRKEVKLRADRNTEASRMEEWTRIPPEERLTGLCTQQLSAPTTAFLQRLSLISHCCASFMDSYGLMCWRVDGLLLIPLMSVAPLEH